MKTTVLKSDREPEEKPLPLKPVEAVPEEKEEIVSPFEFTPENNILLGMYNGKLEGGFEFVANGQKSYVSDAFSIVKEALESVANGTLIKIEYLGYSEEKGRPLFEVSRLD